MICFFFNITNNLYEADKKRYLNKFLIKKKIVVNLLKNKNTFSKSYSAFIKDWTEKVLE